MAVAPLFEQLTENSEFVNPTSPHTKILLHKDQLLESVIKELTEIFGTRSSFSMDDIDALFEHVHEEELLLSGIVGVMGLPNMKNIFAEDSSDWKDFASRCEMVIRLYEPRLVDPVVQVDSFDTQKQRLHLNISGSLKCGSLRETVSFPLPVEVNTDSQEP